MTSPVLERLNRAVEEAKKNGNTTDDIASTPLQGFGNSGTRRPSSFDINSSYQKAQNKIDPRGHTNLSDNGCPKTGPGRAKGTCPIAWGKRKNRNQATGLGQRLEKERLAKGQSSGSSLKYGVDHQRAQTSPNSSHVEALKNVRDSANKNKVVPETPAPVADTTPVAQAPKVETPTLEAPASSGGVFWLFSSFLFIGLIGAALYWWFQRRFGGKRRSTRKPRRWEMVRMQVVTERNSMGHSHYRPSVTNERTSQCRYRTSTICRSPISPPMARSPSMGSYVEVPIASHEPSTWERVSKGGKLN
jgi:hypothetical protein